MPANKQQHSRFQSSGPRVTVQAGWKPNIAKQNRKKEREKGNAAARHAQHERSRQAIQIQIQIQMETEFIPE